MADSNHGGECPYCGDSTKHINNHVRMSAGKHGTQGMYPEDWDQENRERVDVDMEAEGPEPSGDDTEAAGNAEEGGSGGSKGGVDPSQPGGSTDVHGLNDDESATSTGAVPIELEDARGDARVYDCGECGESVPYLSEECPDCGESLRWHGVSA